ncbi:hypothetical protein CPC08DRAFT_707946 [Agrocybe pediades]|nr:hypothetical protein CPC08DRAFT_707946 [Agrocybe pediades]
MPTSGPDQLPEDLLINPDGTWKEESTDALGSGWLRNPSYKQEINDREYKDRNGVVYPVDYSRREMTTGYGLTREPQWSDGPPPIIKYLSPYHAIPLPPPYSLNPILAYNFNGLIWKVNQSPEWAMFYGTTTLKHTYHWQSTPATDPPDIEMLPIHIREFDSVIEIRPRKAFITVGDVLYGIYDALRRLALERSLSWLNPEQAVQFMLEKIVPRSTTEFSGDDRIGDGVWQEMNFRTLWVGLIPSRTFDDVWELYLIDT